MLYFKVYYVREGRLKMDIKLNAKTIAEKDFATSMRGYNKIDIDNFLDEIIKDYDQFKKIIETYEEEIEQLQRKLKQATQQATVSEHTIKVNPQVGATNFDILKRLSNLEKHVFGNKLLED